MGPINMNFTQVEGQLLLGALPGWKSLFAKLFTKYILDLPMRLKWGWKDRRLTMGNAGIARLILSLKDRNVDLWTETAMTDLIDENGSVIGIKATKNNLEKLGFKFAKNLDQLLMRYEREDWGSNKNTRRQHVAKDYRIVMMIGDNLGDFVDDEENSSSPDIRLAAAERHHDMWGKYWFMLANPTYGDWESALIDFKYEIPKSEQLQIKAQALDVK